MTTILFPHSNHSLITVLFPINAKNAQTTVQLLPNANYVHMSKDSAKLAPPKCYQCPNYSASSPQQRHWLINGATPPPLNAKIVQMAV